MNPDQLVMVKHKSLAIPKPHNWFYFGIDGPVGCTSHLPNKHLEIVKTKSRKIRQCVQFASTTTVCFDVLMAVFPSKCVRVSTNAALPAVSAALLPAEAVRSHSRSVARSSSSRSDGSKEAGGSRGADAGWN